ncbi:hypothetical protein HDU91_001572 [Kappamyces sp. JEL0680]|nr:hypothetical protein HDU91_001572 [Kappamyces sp. JEL0680]
MKKYLTTKIQNCSNIEPTHMFDAAQEIIQLRHTSSDSTRASNTKKMISQVRAVFNQKEVRLLIKAVTITMYIALGLAEIFTGQIMWRGLDNFACILTVSGCISLQLANSVANPFLLIALDGRIRSRVYGIFGREIPSTG